MCANQPIFIGHYMPDATLELRYSGLDGGWGTSHPLHLRGILPTATAQRSESWTKANFNGNEVRGLQQLWLISPSLERNAIKAPNIWRRQSYSIALFWVEICFPDWGATIFTVSSNQELQVAFWHLYLDMICVDIWYINIVERQPEICSIQTHYGLDIPPKRCSK